jgi:hypothetical protein
VLLMDLSIPPKRNVSAFQATFFEMLSAWGASFLADPIRISREMNHRACKERRRSLLHARAVAEAIFSSFKVYLRQPDHFPIADHPSRVFKSRRIRVSRECIARIARREKQILAVRQLRLHTTAVVAAMPSANTDCKTRILEFAYLIFRQGSAGDILPRR